MQEKVLEFLNNQLRKTTLQSAVDNARTNFCEPIPHHLRRAKDDEDASLTDGLKQQEKEVSRQKVDQLFGQRRADVDKQLRALKDDVAVKRSGNIKSRTEDLAKKLEEMIKNGSETDAYQIYKDIIADRELRKYPYHFEIEMRIVDNLNTMLKRTFRQIVQDQVNEVFADLVQKVKDALESVRQDVSYDSKVTAPFDDILREARINFCARIDGVVMTLAAQLDELLLFKPRGMFGLLGGNEILEGLEQAARMGFENLKDMHRVIEATDFDGKTRKIRETLTRHYIVKVSEYHTQIAQNIFPIIINNMHEIQQRIFEVMQSKYHPVLEVIKAQATEREFATRRSTAVGRSQHLRETIEKIEQTCRDMAAVLSGTG